MNAVPAVANGLEGPNDAIMRKLKNLLRGMDENEINALVKRAFKENFGDGSASDQDPEADDESNVGDEDDEDDSNAKSIEARLLSCTTIER